MFPSKKKPAVGLKIGKPKDDELDAPDPVDAPPKPQQPEADESPVEEDAEESGASLLGDLIQPLVDAGLDQGDAKQLLAQIFRSAAKCLDGGEDDSAIAEHDAGGMPMEAGEGAYGR